jgi:shikimate dehydrogenase
MRRITGRTAVAGVIGAPVRHSLSPVIHNAWLEAAGIDGVYVALDIPPKSFRSFVEGMRWSSVAGFNVTVPLKELALEVADVATREAAHAGAANVLELRGDGDIKAANTDGLGLVAAFAEQAPEFRWDAGPIVVLGAGGAARGAVAAIGGEVRVVNRTLGRAQALAEAYGCQAYGLEDLERALKDARAVINATSAGLGGGEPLQVPLAATPPDCVVMDMQYRPLATPLLTQARQLGRPTVDGLAMLIGQAVPSFEILFETPPPRDVDVRALALEALAT